MTELDTAIALLPEGELAELEREIEKAEPWFGSFPRESQFARLKVWIGRRIA